MICKKTIKKLANTKSVWFTKVFLVWILLIHAIVYTRHIIIVRSHLIVGSDPKPICSCTSSMLVLTMFAVCTLSGAVVTAVIMALSINASTELNWDNQSRIMMSYYDVVILNILQCRCSCGHCSSMPTDAECQCCKEIKQVTSVTIYITDIITVHQQLNSLCSQIKNEHVHKVNNNTISKYLTAITPVLINRSFKQM